MPTGQQMFVILWFGISRVDGFISRSLNLNVCVAGFVLRQQQAAMIADGNEGEADIKCEVTTGTWNGPRNVPLRAARGLCFLQQ